MNDEGLNNIDYTIEEITRTVEHAYKLSYASKLDMDLARSLGEHIQHNLPRLMETLHETNLFQEAYTKAEVSSIFQNQFLETTKEVIKEYLDRMQTINILEN